MVYSSLEDLQNALRPFELPTPSRGFLSLLPSPIPILESLPLSSPPLSFEFLDSFRVQSGILRLLGIFLKSPKMSNRVKMWKPHVEREAPCFQEACSGLMRHDHVVMTHGHVSSQLMLTQFFEWDTTTWPLGHVHVSKKLISYLFKTLMRHLGGSTHF